MKFTGIVQKIDGKGRIRIPKELINRSNIKDADAIEFVAIDKMLILLQHKKTCDISRETARCNISLANGKVKVPSSEVKQLIKELIKYLG